MSIYDVALIISPDTTLKRANEIFDELSDKGIDVDFGTMEFTDEGLLINAGTDAENVEEIINGIDGIDIDWDTMSEWVDYDGDCDESLSDMGD